MLTSVFDKGCYPFKHVFTKFDTYVCEYLLNYKNHKETGYVVFVKRRSVVRIGVVDVISKQDKNVRVQEGSKIKQLLVLSDMEDFVMPFLPETIHVLIRDLMSVTVFLAINPTQGDVLFHFISLAVMVIPAEVGESSIKLSVEVAALKGQGYVGLVH